MIRVIMTFPPWFFAPTAMSTASFFSNGTSMFLVLDTVVDGVPQRLHRNLFLTQVFTKRRFLSAHLPPNWTQPQAQVCRRGIEARFNRPNDYSRFVWKFDQSLAFALNCIRFYGILAHPVNSFRFLWADKIPLCPSWISPFSSRPYSKLKSFSCKPQRHTQTSLFLLSNPSTCVF